MAGAVLYDESVSPLTVLTDSKNREIYNIIWTVFFTQKTTGHTGVQASGEQL